MDAFIKTSKPTFKNPWSSDEKNDFLAPLPMLGVKPVSDSFLKPTEKVNSLSLSLL